MATIREDVVSIGFEVDRNPFADITDSVNSMKSAVVGGVDDSVEKLKDMGKDASKAADGINNISKATKGLTGQKGLSEMVRDLKELGKAKIGSGLDKLKSIPAEAKGKFDSLKQSISNIKNIKLSDVGKGLDKALGSGVTAAGKLFDGLKKAAAVGFEKTISGVKNLASYAGKATVALGKGLVKGAGVAAAGLGAMGAAVGGLVAKSVSSYADYEQLVGGVETLFKESAPLVENYAKNAYKTAGLSANQYMETVTGFSASLLQSLGGDTAKAAEYGNMAVTDMADNANKMGTDISSIQNAYQGFAKQNYSMLDNLKLG